MRMTGAVSGHGRTGGGVKEVYTGVYEEWFPRGVTLSAALFPQVNGDYHKAGPLRWTRGHAQTQPHCGHTRMYTNTHTYTQPDVRSRWNMDPNGCVPSLKGPRVDLSAVKQLVQLPRGEEGGSSEPEVTGLNPNPRRKHLALRRRHASAFYADLWRRNLWAERTAVSGPDIIAELKLSLHPVPKNIHLDEPEKNLSLNKARLFVFPDR